MKSTDQILQEKLDAAMGRIANEFLKWKLPESVRADLCATSPDPRSYRSGTNLLTFTEALTMANEVVRPIVKEILNESEPLPKRSNDKLSVMNNDINAWD